MRSVGAGTAAVLVLAGATAASAQADVSATPATWRAPTTPARIDTAQRPANAKLPAAATAAVSRAVGRDQPGYHAVRVAGGYRLDGAAGAPSARLDRRGLQLRPGGTTVRLALRAVGRGRTLHALSPVAPAARANRVVYRHPGVSEWFVNGPAGVEQGFTLTRRPSGGRSQALTMRLALTGATAHVDRDARGLTLRMAHGESLRYGGLWATDRRGRRLPARLQGAPGRVVVRVDDRHAAYPVTIDPIIQVATLRPDDGAAGHSSGWSVAESGDTIVVGAPNVNGSFSGAVYVFERPTGGWTSVAQVAKLTRAGPEPDAALGWSVAISGDTIVAGAVNAGRVPGSDFVRGAVDVFVRPAGGWKDATQTAELTADPGAQPMGLGWTVAVSGDTVVAGAYYSFDRAVAYVFQRPASGWADATQSATLDAAHGDVNEFMESSVAAWGDAVAVGVPDAEPGGDARRGAAYVFDRPAGGWTGKRDPSATLTVDDGAVLDALGTSIAMSSDTIVTGAQGTGAYRGTAYVYSRPAGGWATTGQPTARLTASDAADNDQLGYMVAISQDTIVAAGTRGTYRYVRPAGGWVSGVESSRLTGPEAPGLIGSTALAISDGTVAMGAAVDQPEGGVYVFADPTAPTITLSTPVDGARYGRHDVVDASYSCADDPGGSGIASCTGTVPDGTPIDTSTLGQHSFTVTAQDEAGNLSSTTVRYLVADTTAPALSSSVATDGGAGPVQAGGTDNYRGRVLVGLHATDADSGIAHVDCTIDGAQHRVFTPGQPIDPGGSQLVPGAPGSNDVAFAIPFTSAGERSYSCAATDVAGNTSKATAGAFVIDDAPPVTTATSVPADRVGAASVRVDLQAADPSPGAGAASVTTSLDGAAEATHAGGSVSVTFTAQGTHTVTYFATDRLGNVETARTITVYVDRTKPRAPSVDAFFVGVGTGYAGVLSGTAHDDVAVAGVEVTLTDAIGTISYTHTFLASCTGCGTPGTHDVTWSVDLAHVLPARGNYLATVTVTDMAGNARSAGSAAVVVQT